MDTQNCLAEAILMRTHNICFMENYRKLSFNYHQIPPLSVLLLSGGNSPIFCMLSIFNILGSSVAQFLDMILHVNYDGLLTQTRMGLTWLSSILVSIIGPMRCLYVFLCTNNDIFMHS